jgi:exodeoxyribonuclease VII small subunit
MAKKKVKRAESAGSEPMTFEQALARLEKTLAQLEDGQLGLDQSLAQYEQGIKYLKLCYRQLEKAQRKIELLAGIDEDGNVRAEPFEESDMSLEQKQASRSRRRSGSRPGEPPSEDTMDEPGTLF